MPNTNSNGSKIDLKTIATIVSLIVIGSGVVANWATNGADVRALQASHSKLQDNYARYKEKIDVQLVDIKIESAQTTTDITSIKEDVSEIKQDVKKLLRNP